MQFLHFINGLNEYYSKLVYLIFSDYNLIILYRYHTILLKRVKPLHKKCKEIEDDVLEQDQKLILLDNKSQVSFFLIFIYLNKIEIY
jgi:hypothetical protein